jgi:hypothetical protein
MPANDQVRRTLRRAEPIARAVRRALPGFATRRNASTKAAIERVALGMARGFLGRPARLVACPSRASIGLGGGRAGRCWAAIRPTLSQPSAEMGQVREAPAAGSPLATGCSHRESPTLLRSLDQFEKHGECGLNDIRKRLSRQAPNSSAMGCGDVDGRTAIQICSIVSFELLPREAQLNLQTSLPRPKLT